MSPEKRRAADATIDQLLEWDIIEPSSSSVSFPVLMVRQRDKWRFCVDYRGLNAATVPERYPLPTVDSIFNTLLGKRVSSSLDAIRGYHQLPVRPEDRWKTAFACHRGLFQYRTVPFGLRNTPAVFQRLMDRVLGALRWQHAVVYIDDVVVTTTTLAEHVEALRTLLGNAIISGLTFSPSKCVFRVSSLTLLGRKISGAGVAVWQERAHAVRAMPRPTTLRELYHALGLFGYYRAFIKDYAVRAAPLSKLTRGWRWEATEDGRTRLINAAGEPTSADRVKVDWSEQLQRSFDDLKDAITHPLTLAHPDPRRPYVLYVDASRQAFGAVLHQVFASPVVTEPGSAFMLAAACRTIGPAAAAPPLLREKWVAWLRADRHFGRIMRRLEAGEEDGEWVLADGLPVRQRDGKMALPDAAIPEVLKSVHDLKGHFGFIKTYLAVSRNFWRPNLSLAVRSWVRFCKVCQRTKRLPRSGALRIDDDPQFPFDTISLDLVHGLPRSRSGNESFVAILDVFSRLVLLEPCPPTITAAGIASIISNRVLRYGWRPRRLVSDSEARLTGETMTALAGSLNATITPSPPHHQQANAVERAIQTAQSVMKAMALESTAHWDRRILPVVKLALNSTPSLTSGFRPFDLIFMSHPDVAHALLDDDGHPGVASFSERLAAAEERLGDARERILAARTAQQQRYARRRRPLPQLEVGSQVYVRLRDRPVPGEGDGKLAPSKLGPFPVAELLSDHRVRLALPPDLRIGDTFSVDQLDAVPSSPDPFAAHRDAPGTTADSPAAHPPTEPCDAVPLPPQPASLENEPPPLRRRLPPAALREYDLGVVDAASPEALDDLYRGPIFSRRLRAVDGVQYEFRERPVAFLSRLTSVTEQKMAAPELELCCLAWYFTKWGHLLEGAEVTVVTDHKPLGPMLTSTAPIPYGPVITRCRAALLPHLPNLRFHHRAGSSHSNADALSRLPVAPADG